MIIRIMSSTRVTQKSLGFLKLQILKLVKPLWLWKIPQGEKCRCRSESNSTGVGTGFDEYDTENPTVQNFMISYFRRESY